MRLRSLAPLLLALGASTALSVYMGMTQYEQVTPYRAVQPREPTTEPLIQSTKPLAPLSQSTNDDPSLSKPAASIDPPTDSTQTRTLGGTNNNSQEHASDTLRCGPGKFRIKRRRGAEMQYGSLLERISLFRCSRLHLSTCIRATPGL
jgi:hypothetical protein